MKSRIPLLSALFVIACLQYPGMSGLAAAATQSRVASQQIVETIQSEGRARVIVKLRMDHYNESRLTRSRMLRQRRDISSAQRRVHDHLAGTDYTIRRELKTVPYMAVEIDAQGLANLEAASLDVEGIYEDRLAKPFLAESIPQIEADLAWQLGLDGSGSAIAVADSGVDKDHPFLTGKVIEEACYALSEDGVGGDCPNGEATQTTSGAGVPCAFAPLTCRHGTHVAGIAAGSGLSFSGVAPGADLISIQVFHSSLTCGFTEETPCARAFASDVAAALERVYELRNQYSIAAVNLSLGGGASATTCDADHPQLLAVMDNLKAAGIATVVASGNGGFTNAISWPACISTAISVGAVDENDFVAFFSNVSDDLDVFAPGTSIDSSIPGGGFANFNGTSMATPHVAAAFAVLKQADPAATVDANLTLLETTGRPVTDNRGLTSVTKPRIRLGGAVGFEHPLPVLQSIAPTSVTAWRPETTVTVTGSDFSRATVVNVDGTAAPTTYVSDTQLVATVTESMLATSATSFDISVFSPPPGGGTSGSVPLAVVQPSLTVSSTNVAPGDPISVIINDAPGETFTWVAIADVNDPDTIFGDWTYIGEGVLSFTWSVNAPSTLGHYEFRLFKDGGFTRIATSPTVTVAALLPTVASISPTRVLANGPDFTLTVTGTGFIPVSEIQVNGIPRATTYESATELTATIPASDLATTATALAITVFTPQPGGGVSNSLSLDLAHPTLTVSATSVNPGDPITVTLTDGPGGSFDWLALAGVADPDTTYSQWVYVTSGSTGASWTINMPATAGDYEIRLFATGSFTRLTTSPTVTVGTTPTDPPPDPPPPDPGNPPSVAVSATSVGPGDPVTVTLTDGPGGSSDWLALAAVGDPDVTYSQWIYVPAGSTTTTWTVNMPATDGDYEFRLFENGGFSRIATSPSVTVTTPAVPPPDPGNPPSLTVSASSVGPGDPVTVTLTDGPGNGLDWLALAAVGDPDVTYSQWIYVPAGSTTTTWTVNMPATDGDYEFRLFENGGFSRIATSPSVTVTTPADPGSPPVLDVSATSAAPGDAVTVTLTDGPGNDLDWLALANVTDPDSIYLQWIYVPAGATTATWTVNMPSDGNYEFRLFENGGFTRIATSPTVTVATVPTEPPPDPTGPPALDVSTTSAEPGDSVTVTMTNGPGNSLDWLALANVTDPDSIYLQWIYVPAGATTTTWTVSMPSDGDYEFRLFENGGFTRIATSPTVTVATTQPPPGNLPTLDVSATAVVGGDSVTVSLSGGPGNTNDWLALSRVADPDTLYSQWVYVSPGATTATWTVTMPATPGDYEFRLFENGGFTRIATSPTVVVNP